MQKIIHVLGLALLALFVSYSCALEEELTVLKNGSGSFSFALDYSSMMMFDTTGEFSDGLFTEEEIEEFYENTAELEGLSNIRITEDPEENTTYLKGNFASLEHYNSFIDEIMHGDSTAYYPATNSFRWKNKKTFVLDRTNMEGADDLGMDELMEEGSSEEEIRQTMEMMYPYQLTLHFEKPIKSVSYSNHELQNDDKTVVLTGSIVDFFLMTGEPIEITF